MTSGGYGFGFPVVCVVDSLGLESDNKGGLGGWGVLCRHIELCCC